MSLLIPGLPLKVYEVDGKLITVVVPLNRQRSESITSVNATKILQVTICVLTGMEECEVRFVLEKISPKNRKKHFL